jgi:hypothetical protein
MAGLPISVYELVFVIGTALMICRTDCGGDGVERRSKTPETANPPHDAGLTSEQLNDTLLLKRSLSFTPTPSR